MGRLRPAWAIGAALALGLGVFLLRERQLAGVVGFPLDDAWIHFQFARNLAAVADQQDPLVVELRAAAHARAQPVGVVVLGQRCAR